MSASPPIWLLDVDGVLNADKPGRGAPPRRAMAYADGTGWLMRWAPSLIDRIGGLRRAGAVDIRWCTSWCGHTDQPGRREKRRMRRGQQPSRRVDRAMSSIHRSKWPGVVPPW
jgi:hypothetical protein